MNNQLIILTLQRRSTVGPWENATPLLETKTFSGSIEALNAAMVHGWRMLGDAPAGEETK